MVKHSKEGGVRKDHFPTASSKETPVAVTFILKPAVHIFLIAVIGFLVYSNTFKVPFLFDDTNTILKNFSLRDAGCFANKPLYELSFAPRIIGQLTFALNYAVHGLGVVGYHVVNLLIHLGCALLVYWLVALLFRTPYFSGYFQAPVDRSFNVPGLVALLGALLFVSHPVQTQAVTYIAQRYASLATLFYLLSLVLYIRSRLSESARVRYAFYAISIVSAVLAMKTKEIAFTLPVMIVLCEVMFFSGNVRMRLFYLTPFILTMLIIPSTLLVALGPSLTGSGGIDELTKVAGMPDVSRWDYLNTQFRVIVTYIRLLFLPINQNLDYDYPIYRTFFTLPVFLSFLFLLSVFGGGIYLVYRSFRDEGEKTHWYRLIGFGIFWFFITLSVESSVIPIADVIFEHRLYLPSVGFFLAVMAGVMWMRNRTGNKPFVQKAILAFLVLVVAGLSATAYARNMVWQSEVALWEDTVKKSPMKTRPNYNLGLLYSKQGRNDEAINLYQTAIRITPYYYRPYNDLGNAYFNKGRLDDALKEYQTALTLNPDYPESHNNMGIIFAKKKHFGEAIREFDTAIKLKPNYADAHVNLGNVYYEQGLKSEAIKHYQNALKIKPDHITARSNLEKLQGGGF